MPAARPSDVDRSALRRIDDALVPPMQRGARAVAHALSGPGRALRSVDGRLAGGRPAGAVREHRGLAAFLVVGLAFAAVAVHAQRYPVLQERARQVAGDGQRPGDDVVPGSGGDAVGPVEGARVDPYLADRREAMRSADADEVRTAVVSFNEFLDPREVVAVVGDAQVHRVQYRLPERLPRPRELSVDDGDVVAAVEGMVDLLVAELRVEQDEVASTLDSGVEDDAFRADYEARLDELKGLRNMLVSDPAVVFAVVLTAPVAHLQDLAAADDAVRLVDLADSDVATSSTAFFGILPTDRERVSFGRAS